MPNHSKTKLVADNSYKEIEFDTYRSKTTSKGAIYAVLASMPGSIIWLILAYHTPFASLAAIIITFSAIAGFKRGGKYMTYKTKNYILLALFALIFILTTAITSHTLYSQYVNDVIKKSTIDELRESFVTDLRNNGKSVEETEAMLKSSYNINGFNDVEGLNNFVKKTLGETYKDSHKVSVIPDTPGRAVICLFQSLAYNRTIAKPYFFNIVGGIFLCILTANSVLKLKSYKPNIHDELK